MLHKFSPLQFVCLLGPVACVGSCLWVRKCNVSQIHTSALHMTVHNGADTLDPLQRDDIGGEGDGGWEQKKSVDKLESHV